MESKKPYQSKTLIVNAVVAVLALFAPGAAEFISSHPGEVAVAFSMINMALRLISKDKISLSE
jgi:hypothetical protein